MTLFRISLLYLCIAIPAQATIQSVSIKTIILDPAGDIIDTGRICDNAYERTLTLQAAEQLKKNLIQKLPSHHITLTRGTGFIRMPFCTAQLAHRLSADLVIHIAICKSTHAVPRCGIYFQQTGIESLSALQNTALIPAEHAHIAYYEQSKFLGITLYKKLNRLYKGILLTDKPIGIPLKPLQGIAAPALVIELSIVSISDVQTQIDQLSTALISILS